MKSSKILHLITLSSLALFLWGCGTHEAEEPAADEEAPALPTRSQQALRAAPEYKMVEGTEGALKQATLFTQKVPAANAALEVRSVLLLPKTAALRTDRDALYEVVAGEVISQDGEEKKTHRTGDLWIVPKGAKTTLKAKGEIAVLRTITVAGK